MFKVKYFKPMAYTLAVKYFNISGCFFQGFELYAILTKIKVLKCYKHFTLHVHESRIYSLFSF